MSNRKRSAGRVIQSIVCSATIVRKGEIISNPKAGKRKQIKHPIIGALPNDPWGMSKAQGWEKVMAEDLRDNRYRYQPETK